MVKGSISMGVVAAAGVLAFAGSATAGGWKPCNPAPSLQCQDLTLACGVGLPAPPSYSSCSCSCPGVHVECFDANGRPWAESYAPTSDQTFTCVLTDGNASYDECTVRVDVPESCACEPPPDGCTPIHSKKCDDKLKKCQEGNTKECQKWTDECGGCPPPPPPACTEKHAKDCNKIWEDCQRNPNGSECAQLETTCAECPNTHKCIGFLTLENIQTGQQQTFDTIPKGANVTFTVGGASGVFHVSCSQLLCPNQVSGGLRIVDLDTSILEQKHGPCP